MYSETFTGKDLFGRLREKNIFKERTKAFKSGFRKNIAILGRPFVGKTSLIKNFILELSAEGILPLYIEAREEAFEFFTQRFIGALLYQYLKLKNAKVKKDDLKTLIKHCEKPLPKTAEAIIKAQHCLDKKDYDGAYDILLDMPRLLLADSGCPCAVIIEEFDKLATYKLTQPFLVLGKKIMSQHNIFYIVTSSSVAYSKNILSEKLQILFGNFEIMELENFDFLTSKDFLFSQLEPFIISERHIKFLISFTNGHPFYLDVLSLKLKVLLSQSKKRKVTTLLLCKALSETLFYPLGQLHQHFNSIIYRHCISKNGVDILSILLTLSEQNYKLRRLIEIIDHSPKSISCAISNLQNAGLIEKVGALNRIEDSVFRFWLKTVYHRRRMDFTQDSIFAQRAFINSVKKISTDFTRSSKEDLYEKIIDLFKSFKDDAVQLGQKRYRLPVFNDVAIRIIGQNGPYIIGHAKGSNWICQIHERQICEKHILDFLKDTKSGKYKFHRKILIALNGIDDNAKLLSKESGVWIWNLKVLNLLLDLYAKHKVVIY
jgi:DNA-binding transcriptional regulator GbsR (MarR family)